CTLTGRSLRVSANNFVFCVGGIETARLLLQPLENGQTAPWTLGHDVLGRYFQDHPTFECADIVVRDPGAVHHLMDMIYHRGFKYQPRLYLHAKRQKELRTLNVGGILLFKSTISAQTLHHVNIVARQLMRRSLRLESLAEVAKRMSAVVP